MAYGECLIEQPTKVICLDIGGVMVNIRPTWPEVCAAIGHESEVEGVLDDCPGFTEYQAGQIGEEEYFKLLRAFLGLPSHIDPSVAHAAILREDVHGMPEAMRTARGQGVRLGCLSNTNDLHWQEMHSGRFEFPEYLDYKIASHICGESKPAPAIYELFEEACGESGSDILFLDDTQVNVDAAKRFGWRALHVKRPSDAPSLMLNDIEPKG